MDIVIIDLTGNDNLNAILLNKYDIFNLVSTVTITVTITVTVSETVSDTPQKYPEIIDLTNESI
jgi:hypothetical protein